MHVCLILDSVPHWQTALSLTWRLHLERQQLNADVLQSSQDWQYSLHWRHDYCIWQNLNPDDLWLINYKSAVPLGQA